jgi:hypothetical protein
MTIWYIFPSFGIMYQEKSGNPGVAVFLFPRLPLDTGDMDPEPYRYPVEAF